MTMTDFLNQMWPLAPEVLLAVGTMAMMMVGAFSRGSGFKLVSGLSVVLWAAVGYMLYTHYGIVTFGNMLSTTPFSNYFKILLVVGTIVSLLMALKDLEGSILARFEYPVLMGFSLLGMFIMVSSNDLIMLYVGLELSSLALYVLAAFNRNSSISSEAGLKYFVLGAIASGLILFGSSLLYGFAGTTLFDGIGGAIAATGGNAPVIVAFGMALLLAGIAFKISAVPFHVWTPDVYDGAPTSVTAFFAIVPQVAAIALLISLLSGPFAGIQHDWQPILMFMSVASMLVGSFAALVQTNIKRLLAYSSIGNIGFSLIGLAVLSHTAYMAVFLYAIVYMITSAGIFSIILQLRKGGQSIEKISDLSGLSKTHPVLAYAMAGMMFSTAGIPPLAGFFAKLAIFQSAVATEHYILATIGLLTSVVGAWYYINLIRVMFFESAENSNVTMVKAPWAMLVMVLSLIFLILFVFVPGVFDTFLQGSVTGLKTLFGS